MFILLWQFSSVIQFKLIIFNLNYKILLTWISQIIGYNFLLYERPLASINPAMIDHHSGIKTQEWFVHINIRTSKKMPFNKTDNTFDYLWTFPWLHFRSEHKEKELLATRMWCYQKPFYWTYHFAYDYEFCSILHGKGHGKFMPF